MFTYWKGYEIDGSSTTYNIVIPQREIVSEVLRYFLNLEIMDRKDSFFLSYSNCDNDISEDVVFKNETYEPDEIDKIFEILERPSTRFFSLGASCIHPDKLYHKVREELYRITKTRPGAEHIECNYKNPTISPLYSPPLSVAFEVSFDREGEGEEAYEPEGLVFNRQALIDNIRGNHLTVDLGCGPGFIYEYAVYIVSKIAGRFPDIGIDGGLDCAGGFVDGCTYSCSLYAYERVTLLTENISQTIQRILQEGIVEPQKRSGKYGRDFSASSNLYLLNLNDVDQWNDEFMNSKQKFIKGIAAGKDGRTPEEYEQFARKVSEITLFDSTDFTKYCTCGVKIGDHIGALTCIKEYGRIWLEFRVVPEIRVEFENKLRQLGLIFK
ncbi:MAG: hypothetical protein N2645_08590 [Clostridia bacterium]|nr:hypothetical protein [Clostridia bacterium]